MLSYRDFSCMRLSDFVRDPAPLDDWEFMGRLWVGEALGFTEWLCPAEKPTELGSLSVDLVAFEHWEDVLRRLQLPLKKGMRLTDVQQVLGRPTRRIEWEPTRFDAEFIYPPSQPYWISCTFRDADGLIYLTIMLPQYAQR